MLSIYQAKANKQIFAVEWGLETLYLWYIRRKKEEGRTKKKRERNFQGKM